MKLIDIQIIAVIKEELKLSFIKLNKYNNNMIKVSMTRIKTINIKIEEITVKIL